MPFINRERTGTMRVFSLVFFSLLPALGQAQPVMLSGNLSSAGSDTLGYLMTLWGDDFSRQAPGVNVQVQASGSSTAPTALTAGAVQLGAMSRPMQADERQAFEARYGYPPLAVPVAKDALVVVVNQRNPLREIDPRQLDAVFPSPGFAARIRFHNAGVTWDCTRQNGSSVPSSAMAVTPPREHGAFSNSRRCVRAISAMTWPSFPALPPWYRP